MDLRERPLLSDDESDGRLQRDGNGDGFTGIKIEHAPSLRVCFFTSSVFCNWRKHWMRMLFVLRRPLVCVVALLALMLLYVGI